jgi:hypothetical protein
MPSAHALGLGDVRLELTRPICAFFEMVLNDGSFPFSELFLPSRRYTGKTRWGRPQAVSTLKITGA